MIDNNEFNKLCNDSNNIALAKSILKRFKLSPDDRREVYLIALWKATQKYKQNQSYKFSTIFCRYIIYESLRVCNEHSFSYKNTTLIDKEAAPEINIDELLEPANQYKEILKMKYLDKMTLEEIAKILKFSKEKVRKDIKKGLNIMKKFYEKN